MIKPVVGLISFFPSKRLDVSKIQTSMQSIGVTKNLPWTETLHVRVIWTINHSTETANISWLSSSFSKSSNWCSCDTSAINTAATAMLARCFQAKRGQLKRMKRFLDLQVRNSLYLEYLSTSESSNRKLQSSKCVKNTPSLFLFIRRLAFWFLCKWNTFERSYWVFAFV